MRTIKAWGVVVLDSTGDEQWDSCIPWNAQRPRIFTAFYADKECAEDVVSILREGGNTVRVVRVTLPAPEVGK